MSTPSRQLRLPAWVPGDAPSPLVFLVSYIQGRISLTQRATKGPWRKGDWSADFGTIEQSPTCIEHAPGMFQYPTMRTRDDVSECVLPLEDGDEYEANLDFIIAHGPDEAMARHEAALALLERHVPYEGRCIACMQWCDCPEDALVRDCPCRGNEPWPCPDVILLFRSYRLFHSSLVPGSS